MDLSFTVSQPTILPYPVGPITAGIIRVANTTGSGRLLGISGAPLSATIIVLNLSTTTSLPLIHESPDAPANTRLTLFNAANGAIVPLQALAFQYDPILLRWIQTAAASISLTPPVTIGADTFYDPAGGGSILDFPTAVATVVPNADNWTVAWRNQSAIDASGGTYGDWALDITGDALGNTWGIWARTQGFANLIFSAFVNNAHPLGALEAENEFITPLLGLRPIAFGALGRPTPLVGYFAYINDSTTTVANAIITGGGSFSVLAVFDGTNWRVVGGVEVANVVGPSSAVNNHVVFFDGTTGKLIKDSGLTLSGTNTGDQNLFSMIQVSGQANVTADTTTQALTFVAGTNIALTTNNTSKQVTISQTANTNYSLPQLANVAITDSSLHTLATINSKSGVIVINSVRAGVTTIPFYSNGGAGVGFVYSVLDPDTGWIINSSISFAFTDGSSVNTYTVAISFGGGSLTIQRTAGASNYTVSVYAL